MRTLHATIITIIQSLCLITILWTSWLLLDTPIFALVAASIVLAATLYLEHTYLMEEPD